MRKQDVLVIIASIIGLSALLSLNYFERAETSKNANQERCEDIRTPAGYKGGPLSPGCDN